MSGPREGAIFPTEWPTCDGQPHPDWDEPWERLTNLYNWYIRRGFTFWQGDLNGAQSGAAERSFGFGKIQPAGAFDGDGVANQDDLILYITQWNIWSSYTPGSTEMLTYYHGDLNGDGVVTQADKDIALGHVFPFVALIGNPHYPCNTNTYWLGDPQYHTMTWNPNQKWLPCCCGTSPGGGP